MSLVQRMLKSPEKVKGPERVEDSSRRHGTGHFLACPSHPVCRE